MEPGCKPDDNQVEPGCKPDDNQVEPDWKPDDNQVEPIRNPNGTQTTQQKKRGPCVNADQSTPRKDPRKTRSGRDVYSRPLPPWAKQDGGKKK